MTAAAPQPLGTVAHFTLLERMEPAGPGELFRARDTRLGRTVAVRLLPAAFCGTAAAREALLTRARETAALSHPNVTALFDAGEQDGRVYLAFEYLKGQPLRAEMGGRPMNVRRAVELSIQIADAMAEAHALGFVHGGLSPDTVIITPRGHAKIPAFELTARAGFEEDSSGVRLRDYDSPEEARGQDADERSDIYSIGAILFEALTARRPLHRGAAAPGATNPHVPPELDTIVLTAVAPDPARRYQTAATLAAELRSLAAILDIRGSDGDDTAGTGGVRGAAGSGLVRAALILLLAALVLWWLL